MRVLWLCNIALPQVCEHIGIKASVFGGWLYDMSDYLAENKEIEFSVCFPLNNKKETDGAVGKINYYTFKTDSVFKAKEKEIKRFEEILKEVKPDMIHIFGTEYSHTLAMMKALERQGLKDKAVVSIQGLVSVISRHYYSFLPNRVIYSSTIRDLLRWDNIYKSIKKFEKRGKNEIKALRLTENVIGRTDWDRANALRINDKVKYHFCNESLRPPFYSKAWDYNTCEKHSIFLSQGNTPIKGFHLMLKALAILVKKYPDVHLYLTGESLFNKDIKSRIKRTAYDKYLLKLIKKYSLNDNITFLGYLSAEQMADRMVNSNLFVLCSTIENSPNSLGEAMLMGVPCIASDVGGVKNMLTDKKDGYIYPADEPYMIANYADEIFQNIEKAKELSANAKQKASITHNRDINNNRLIEIYKNISEGAKIETT